VRGFGERFAVYIWQDPFFNGPMFIFTEVNASLNDYVTMNYRYSSLVFTY
jgi:hypothetical protein